MEPSTFANMKLDKQVVYTSERNKTTTSAMIKVRIFTSGNVSVTYVKTHIAHENEKISMHLQKHTRDIKNFKCI